MAAALPIFDTSTAMYLPQSAIPIFKRFTRVSHTDILVLLPTLLMQTLTCRYLLLNSQGYEPEGTHKLVKNIPCEIQIL